MLPENWLSMQPITGITNKNVSCLLQTFMLGIYFAFGLFVTNEETTFHREKCSFFY